MRIQQLTEDLLVLIRLTLNPTISEIIDKKETRLLFHTEGRRED